MNQHIKSIADRYVARDGGAPTITQHAASESLVHVANDNGAPPLESPYDTISREIEDLFGEAKNWADGEPIADQKQADAVTALLDMVSDAMKRADEARKEENRPFDEGKAAVQEKYNRLIGKTTKLTGRAVLAKEALLGLLTPWRQKLEDERHAEAARLAKEAADAAAAAQAAMQASRGNLEEREKAEELYQAAQDIERVAKRADKAATTKTGLRSVWSAEMVNQEAAMDWAFERAPERFRELTQQLADEAVRGGLRKVPGFNVVEERVAR